MTCKKCGSPLKGSFCQDKACPYHDRPQFVDLGDMLNLSTAEVDAKYGIAKRGTIPEMDRILERYRIERDFCTSDSLPFYRFYGTRGAEFYTLRNVPNPCAMFIVNANVMSSTDSIAGIKWFTDGKRGGTPATEPLRPVR